MAEPSGTQTDVNPDDMARRMFVAVIAGVVTVIAFVVATVLIPG